MGFVRDFTETQINKMTGGDNAELFALLKADVLNGIVFPAVRKNELHFYYKGGCLYNFCGGSFKRDKNFEKFGVGYDFLPPYERAKKEVETKFRNAAGTATERQLLDGLYRHTFHRERQTRVVVLDVEVNLGGQAVRKCDLTLLNTQTDELMFVEGKVFSDSRVLVARSFVPEVILQVNTYSAAIAEQRSTILEQYARHTQILNRLFDTAYRPPKTLIEPAKLLVYGTPHGASDNGRYSIEKINAALGANNVFWAMKDKYPSLDEIWLKLSSNVAL